MLKAIMRVDIWNTDMVVREVIELGRAVVMAELTCSCLCQALDD